MLQTCLTVPILQTVQWILGLKEHPKKSPIWVSHSQWIRPWKQHSMKGCTWTLGTSSLFIAAWMILVCAGVGTVSGCQINGAWCSLSCQCHAPRQTQQKCTVGKVSVLKRACQKRKRKLCTWGKCWNCYVETWWLQTADVDNVGENGLRCKLQDAADDWLSFWMPVQFCVTNSGVRLLYTASSLA